MYGFWCYVWMEMGGRSPVGGAAESIVSFNNPGRRVPGPLCAGLSPSVCVSPLSRWLSGSPSRALALCPLHSAPATLHSVRSTRWLADVLCGRRARRTLAPAIPDILPP